MKQLWTGKDPVKLSILRSELEARGIRFSIRNEDLQVGIGEIPPIEAWPEIWINDNEEYGEAKAILEDIDSADTFTTE